jgi:2-aminoadipate transaminase
VSGAKDRAGVERAPVFSRRAGWVADSPISSMMQKALSQPELVSLAAGFVDLHSLPVEAMRSAALSVLAELETARTALQYNATCGDPVLRGQVLERVLDADRAAVGGSRNTQELRTVPLERVVLTAGSNQLLYLIGEALLDPGDIVLCDSPTYFVFTGILRGMGARAIGIDSDAGGMRADALERELARLDAAGELDRVKAIYVMSYFDNPRSVTLSRERRAQIVRAARVRGRQPIYVIEDAAYRELRFTGDDLPSLFSEPDADQHVIYAGTFSKSFSPGVRVGYGILPESLIGAVLTLKGNLDFGSPNFSQRVVSEALRLGLVEPHVASLRTLYARKCEAMLAALDRELGNAATYQRPSGGLYVWLQLNEDIDTGPSGSLFEHALEEGMLYVPGEYCFPEAGNVSRSCMRLSFGVQSEERIDLGIRRLARAVARAR